MAFYGSAGRKVAELEAARAELVGQVAALSAAAATKDALLEERQASLATLEARSVEMRAEIARLHQRGRERDEQLTALQNELKEEKRTSERYLEEIVQQEKMLTMICAYRTDDERKDASRLLQENLGLEERVRQLKLQVKRLAAANVAALDDDEG